jgi:hypothetical protein
MIASFRREVLDDIIVSIDGVVDLDPDITARPASRVLVELPDYAADALAHLLADACAVAEVFGGFPDNGLDGRALADALYAAATSGAYRCHEGGLPAISQPRR